MQRGGGDGPMSFATVALSTFVLSVVGILVAYAVLPGLIPGWQSVVITSGSMHPRIRVGDVVVAGQAGAGPVETGTVAVFQDPAQPQRLLTHRVHQVDPDGTTWTKGDANGGPDSTAVDPAALREARILVPMIGLPLIWVREGAALPLVAALLVLGAAARSARSRPAAPRERLVGRVPLPVPPVRAGLAALLVVAVVAPALVVRPAAAALSDTTASAGNSWSSAASFPGSCPTAQFRSRQSGTITSTTSGTTATATITAVDPAKAFVIATMRSNSSFPSSSMAGVQLASATTVEVVRPASTNANATLTVEFQVVEYSCGVRVQRGVTPQRTDATPTDVALAPLGATDRAFTLFTKPAPVGPDFDADEPMAASITSTTNLQFRSSRGSGANIYWQVVEFLNDADIDVQRGSTSITGAATSATATLSAAVDMARTFVLASGRVPVAAGGTSYADLGRRMFTTTLASGSTITFQRGVGGGGAEDALTEIAWEAVTLHDGSAVLRGPVNLASGYTSATNVPLPRAVDLRRAVVFSGTQMAAGQSLGRTAYISNDILGVASFVPTLTSATTLRLERGSGAASADVALQLVEFGQP